MSICSGLPNASEVETHGAVVNSFKASEAKSQFYRLLDIVDDEGGACIQHRDGRRYIVHPDRNHERFDQQVKLSSGICMNDVVDTWRAYWEER